MLKIIKRTNGIITLFCIVDDHESSGWVSFNLDYYNPILKSAYFTLMEDNYQLQFEIVTYEEAVNKRIILNKTLDSSTDGLLLLITSKNDYSFLAELSDFPLVTLNATVSSSFCSVKVNDQLGTYEAVNYLLSLGHQDIAHIKARPIILTLPPVMRDISKLFKRRVLILRQTISKKVIGVLIPVNGS